MPLCSHVDGKHSGTSIIANSLLRKCHMRNLGERSPRNYSVLRLAVDMLFVTTAGALRKPR